MSTVELTSSERTRVWLVAALAATALILVSYFFYARVAPHVDQLPPSERRALYQRTRQTLETSCTNASGASLIDYCREQAEFIKQFPECDSECHSLVVRFTPAPAR